MATVSHAQMLIRSSPNSVFNAFVEPKALKRYWLKSASARLGPGASVRWEFRVPGATETVEVTKFVEARTIHFSWSDGKSVELEFMKRGRSSTVVDVTVRGFKGRNAVPDAIATTEGFAIVLCDLKSLLETGRSGGMVRDKAALIASAVEN